MGREISLKKFAEAEKVATFATAITRNTALTKQGVSATGRKFFEKK